MKLIKPVVGGHDGSSFRELGSMWGELGLCEVVDGKVPEKPWLVEESLLVEARPWLNEVGDVLLYDNPILDKLHEGLNWNIALWSNTVYKSYRSSPWIFWPRWPRRYNSYLDHCKPKKYNERTIESIFLGNLTTATRNGTWVNHVELFNMGHHSQNLESHMVYPYDKYLEALSNSKFGLCLAGVGPKCLRDIELIGLGTVPIFTPGCCTKYYNKLEENVHYLYADSPDQITNLTRECSEEHWAFMSNECQEWYNKNCSPEGSFNTTMNILEKEYAWTSQ